LTFYVHISESRFGGALKTQRRWGIRPQITYSEVESNVAFLDKPAGLKERSAQATVPHVRTEVHDLATDFEAAFQAINEDTEDIHVGKLLSACERLESTMRKIGFNQGAKDIGGNIGKIRNLYNRAPIRHRDSMPELLQYELESGVHDCGRNGERRIKDHTAAMGFLWLGRTLNYQYDMFRYMLDEKEEPYEAAKHAYEQDLKKHHSWAVQKVCQAAMMTLKPMKRSTVLSSLGGFSEECFGVLENDATNRDLHQMMNSWKPMLSKWKEVFSDMKLEAI